MREHGVLRRVLLVYDEIARRIEEREPFPPEALGSAAAIIRRFVEDYHGSKTSCFPASRGRAGGSIS